MFFILCKLALAPAAILLFYIYARDRFDKEPLKMVLAGTIMGAASIGPILGVDLWLKADLDGIKGVLYNAFVTSAFTEEGFKYVFLILLTIKNPNLNNSMEGIVYAACVSLGFAAAENLIYVLSPETGGLQTALMRGFFSVPGHFAFSIAMGTYYEMAVLDNKKYGYVLAFLIPFAMHGVFNVILLLEMDNYLIFFIPYVLYLWFFGIKNTEKRFKAQTVLKKV